MKCNLPKKTLRLWQIRIVIVFLLLETALLCFFPLTLWVILPAAIILLLFFLVLLWYLPALHKTAFMEVNKETVTVSKGVIIKTTHIMPFPRLIFARTITTPLSKRLGLSLVLLKAARGSILIPEIEEKYANSLVKSISEEEII